MNVRIRLHKLTPKIQGRRLALRLRMHLRLVRTPKQLTIENENLQDGGDGHVGTVVEVGTSGSRVSPDKTVIVQWDNGRRTNYRVGHQGAYDLLVFDAAPAGMLLYFYFRHNSEIFGIYSVYPRQWFSTIFLAKADFAKP